MTDDGHAPKPGRNYPAAPVVQYMTMLRDSGVPMTEMAEATGVGLRTLRHINAGQRGYVRWYTAELVFSLPIGEHLGRHRRSARRAALIVRFLKAVGMSNKQIARRIGVTDASRIGRQRYVRYETERRLAVAVRLLARQGLVPAALLEEVT